MNVYRKTIGVRGAVNGLLAITLFGVIGCNDLMTVDNPGLITDEALNSPTMVPAIVAGMAAELSRAVMGSNGSSELATAIGLETTQASHEVEPYRFGIIPPENAHVITLWENMHRARWTAESGIKRIQREDVLGTDYDRNQHAARANLIAGFANRMLGEFVCHAVIDGGPAQPREVHFERAESYFTEAARIAAAAGAENIGKAALGGRASVRAWQGNWSGAVADASQVPPSFVYQTIFSVAGINNALFVTFYTNWYSTVAGTVWGEVEDPRTPFELLLDPGGGVIVARDGRTQMWQQTKFPGRNSPIPLTSGKEMLVLRAEAALRSGNVAGATAFMNENRVEWGMDPVSEPGNEADAWELLKFERGATLWLEQRRFWDLSRWYEEGRDNSLEGRDRCVPIAMSELSSNPNL